MVILSSSDGGDIVKVGRIPSIQKLGRVYGVSSIWLERYIGIVEVAGSNPVSHTKYQEMVSTATQGLWELLLSVRIRFS